jgi:hypothetical protein
VRFTLILSADEACHVNRVLAFQFSLSSFAGSRVRSGVYRQSVGSVSNRMVPNRLVFQFR